MRRNRENEESRKDSRNSAIPLPPPGRQSPVDRQMMYKKPQRLYKLYQIVSLVFIFRGYGTSEDFSRQLSQYSQDLVPQVSGQPQEKLVVNVSS